MKDFEQREKHLRRFLKLSIAVFAVILFVHGVRLFYGWDLLVEGTLIPAYVSWLAVFITASMIVMGKYYLKK